MLAAPPTISTGSRAIIERAENVARIIEASQPHRRAAARPMRGAERMGERADRLRRRRDLLRAIRRRPTRPMSSTIWFDARQSVEHPQLHRTARTNARAVRTALTVEMWEAINNAWLELQAIRARAQRRPGSTARTLDRLSRMREEDVAPLRRLAYRTMLRNDAYYSRGSALFIERADNTARDPRREISTAAARERGGRRLARLLPVAAILRSVSAHTAYHWVYRESLKPWLIADLLILRPEMPRSLISCYENIVRYLDRLATTHGRQGAAQRHARAIYGNLENMSMDALFQGGLHEFVGRFINDNTQLGTLVSEQYLF